jgi:hypothetical protein
MWCDWLVAAMSRYSCEILDFAQERSGPPLSSPTLGFSTCKTKRPGLSLSPGTSVDQPSHKCCSRTTLVPSPASVNGPYVLRVCTRVETVGIPRNQRPRPLRPDCRRRAGHPVSLADGVNFVRKTKRPRLDLSPGTSVDQPSPKCCSRTTVVWAP